MRPLFLTAALLASAAASAQEVELKILPGPSIRSGEFERPGDVDRYRFPLQAGHDYAVMISTASNGEWFTARLRDPSGRVIGKTTSSSSVDRGFEARVRVTGEHVLELVNDQPGEGYPIPYRFRLMTDCRADATTRCRIKPNRPQQRQFASAVDEDWHRAALKRGRTYTLAVDSNAETSEIRLAFRDASGRVLAEGYEKTLSYRPARDGRYFVSFGEERDAGGPYRVTLTVR